MTGESNLGVEVLEKLKAGIRRFRSEVYPAHADMYQRAGSEPQKPSALIVACADSRIGVEQITQSRTGEVFVTRNIGNLVPAYGEMKLVYRGQLDDSRPQRASGGGNDLPVTGKDLRGAMEDVIAGKRPDPNQRFSVGCNIKWSS